jgi:hypothetical protein
VKGYPLAVRVRELLAPYSLREERALGGSGFLLNDKLVASVKQQTVLARVGRGDLAAAMRVAAASLPTTRTGATIPGFILFDETVSDVELAKWLDRAVALVGRLSGIGTGSPGGSRR